MLAIVVGEQDSVLPRFTVLHGLHGLQADLAHFGFWKGNLNTITDNKPLY
jgi:hypothetical protein